MSWDGDILKDHLIMALLMAFAYGAMSSHTQLMALSNPTNDRYKVFVGGIRRSPFSMIIRLLLNSQCQIRQQFI